MAVAKGTYTPALSLMEAPERGNPLAIRVMEAMDFAQAAAIRALPAPNGADDGAHEVKTIAGRLPVPAAQEKTEWSHMNSNHGPPACEDGSGNIR